MDPSRSTRSPVGSFNSMPVEAGVLRYRGLQLGHSYPAEGYAGNFEEDLPQNLEVLLWLVWGSGTSSSNVMGCILEFLQSEVDGGLSLNAIKDHILALQSSLETDCMPLVQGVTCIAPMVKTPLPLWDLNFLLSALKKSQFECIQDIPLVLLTRKIIFLVAVTSAHV